MIFRYRIRLACLAAALLPVVFSTGSQRWQADSNMRGNSFGLENFLFHGYEESTIDEPVKDVEKIRPAGAQKSTINEQPVTFQATIPPKFASTSVSKQPTLRPTAETIRKTAIPFTVKPEESYLQRTTEGTKPRLVMRRRKRPYNALHADGGGGGQGPETKFGKTTKYPGSSSTSRITIKTTLSPVKSGDLLKTRPVNVKPITVTTTLRPEMSQEERIQQIEITRIAEHSTPSTAKKTVSPERAYTINLKDFLKQQTETLSLSELLQTQNLSLTDLLKGHKDASAILKAKQMTSPSTTSTTDFKRNTIYATEQTTQGPSIVHKMRDFSKKSNSDTATLKSTFKTPTKTTSTPANWHKNEEPFKNKETTKTTTRKTSLYTVSPLSFDPQTRINEFRAKIKNYQRKYTTKEPETSTLIPEKSKVTAAATTTTTTVFPVSFTGKTIEIPSYKNKRIPYKSSNNPDLSLIVPDKTVMGKDKQEDNISGWTSNKLHQTKIIESEGSKQTDNLILKVPGFEVSTEILKEKPYATETTIVTTTTTTRIDVTPPENFKKPEVKDDLIELLRSGHGGEALRKVLQSRNMTLEEVLNNREKSTVHGNIEELFASQQTSGIPYNTQATVHYDGTTAKETDYDRKDLSASSNKYHVHPQSGWSLDGKSDPILSRESKQYSIPLSTVHEESVLNLKPDDLTADTSNTENLALWQLSEKSIVYGSTFAQGGPLSVKHYTDRPKMYRKTPEPEDDIILLETLERNQETARKYKLGLDDFLTDDSRALENTDRSYIPPAVKSTIIASGVVMGLAVLVFIAIFTVCGWRQRRIRLRGNSSILSQTTTTTNYNSQLTKNRDESKRTDTLTPLNFNDVKTYKKTIEFEDGDSESGTSFTGSYLWSTFKNTFTTRTNTLKARLEKERKSKDDKLTLRGNEGKKKLRCLEDPEDFTNDYQTQEGLKKIDRTRQVISTSFNFKRSPSKDNVNYVSECSHRY